MKCNVMQWRKDACIGLLLPSISGWKSCDGFSVETFLGQRLSVFQHFLLVSFTRENGHRAMESFTCKIKSLRL